jgi:hypothetical protein
MFEPGTHGMVRKLAVQRKAGEASFHMVQWRVICFDGDRFELDFQRPIPANAVLATASLSYGGAIPFSFTYPPRRGAGVEQWGMRLSKASLQPLLDLPQAEFIETSLAPDGRQLPLKQTLSGDGLARSLDALLGTCPPAKPQTLGANEQAAAK